MLAKSLISILVFLISISVVSAVSIQYCKSGSDNWVCYTDDVCECKTSGECTKGNLIVYKSNHNSPSCLPRISSGYAIIDWTNCGEPDNTMKVKADCNEGQSEEYELIIELSPATTTSSSTTTTTTISSTTTTREIPERTTTTFRATTTTIRKTSSNKNTLIGFLLILFALAVIGIIVFLKNQKKF